MAALDKRGETGVLSNTDVHYFGPAANAQKTADLLNKLSNGNKYSVELQRHKYDFVGGLIGGNPATMDDAPEGYNQLKAIGGMFGFDGKNYSVHSCYGLGKRGCGDTYGPAQSKIIKAQGTNFKMWKQI